MFRPPHQAVLAWQEKAPVRAWKINAACRSPNKGHGMPPKASLIYQAQWARHLLYKTAGRLRMKLNRLFIIADGR